MLYSKQLTHFNETSLERTIHSSNTANDITDLNINERITKFKISSKMNLSIGYLYLIFQISEK